MIIQKLRKFISGFSLFSLLFILGESNLALAVPAKPGVLTFDNGGKEIEVFLKGDEHSHFYVTTDGYMLLRGRQYSFG